jgi:hypothetical protein
MLLHLSCMEGLHSAVNRQLYGMPAHCACSCRLLVQVSCPCPASPTGLWNAPVGIQRTGCRWLPVRFWVPCQKRLAHKPRNNLLQQLGSRRCILVASCLKLVHCHCSICWGPQHGSDWAAT